MHTYVIIMFRKSWREKFGRDWKKEREGESNDILIKYGKMYVHLIHNVLYLSIIVTMVMVMWW